MTAVWLLILGWKEVVCTFDATQYAASLQTLQREGISFRTRITNISSASRRTGTLYTVGERMDRSIEYQVFVKKADSPRAQLALQGRLHTL